MNAQNAKDYLPLVKALSEGKVIQLRDHRDVWFDHTPEVQFNLHADRYRVKPEAMVIWVKAYKGQLTAHFTEAEARLHSDSTSHGPIKFIQADP